MRRMENLVFSLNATVPIFLMMVLGMLFRKLGWMDEEFAAKMNKFVFLIPLPVLLFGDLAKVDFKEVWNIKFVIFCFVVTFICITIAALVSCIWKDRSIQGEFIQASYRSSAALLGIAFIQNIYGNAGMAPLMIIGSVPLYNVMAVIVLSFFHPERKAIDKAVWMKTLKGIVTNPIIIGIVAGLIWSACKIPMPVILNKTVTSIGGMSTPMGLMAMGATFDFRESTWKDQTGCDSNNYEVGCICGNFSSDCCETGIPSGRTDCNPCNAWIRNNSKQFCYGKEYGT